MTSTDKCSFSSCHQNSGGRQFFILTEEIKNVRQGHASAILLPFFFFNDLKMAAGATAIMAALFLKGQKEFSWRPYEMPFVYFSGPSFICRRT